MDSISKKLFNEKPRSIIFNSMRILSADLSIPVMDGLASTTEIRDFEKRKFAFAFGHDGADGSCIRRNARSGILCGD
jgi:hypothetical protein